jgi:hypothetical protein
MTPKQKEKLLQKIDNHIDSLIQLGNQIEQQSTCTIHLATSKKLLHDTRHRLVRLFDHIQQD